MDAAELIERTTAAVAEGYRALDLADAAGLLLDSYYDGAPEQFAPLALELREGEATPEVDRDGYQRELGAPEVERDPSVFELREAMNEHVQLDDDGRKVIASRRVGAHAAPDDGESAAGGRASSPALRTKR